MCHINQCRAVYRNFAKGGGGGGKFGVRTKEGGGAEAYVGCYTLHLLGGGGGGRE